MKRPRIITFQTFAQQFVAQFPIVSSQNPAAPDLTRFDNREFDDFALANGQYQNVDTSNVNDLNAARHALIDRLNALGETKKWQLAGQDGFYVAVVNKKPTLYEVQPLDIAMARLVTAMPDKNMKTIRNRAVRAIKKMERVPALHNSRAERKLLEKHREEMVQIQILNDNVNVAMNKIAQAAQKRLAKVEPQSRLLPKP